MRLEMLIWEGDYRSLGTMCYGRVSNMDLYISNLEFSFILPPSRLSNEHGTWEHSRIDDVMLS